MALSIVEEVYKQMGLSDKINVIFRDEEIIPDDVVDFVQSKYHSGKYNFGYFCLQLKSEKYILGNKYEYIQWDKNRSHIRPVPEFAITDWTKVYDQYTSGPITTNFIKGRKCIITGIRADESLIRYQGIIAKKNKSHIAASIDPDIWMGRIIYDFSENDIFKYLHDNKVPYCTIYDNQMFNGEAMRVSTPLHAESAKKLYKLKTIYPKFYDQILSIFPDVELQARYYTDFDRYSIMNSYEHSYKGIVDYIRENVDESMQNIALKRVADARKTRINNIRNGNGIYGGYPVLYVFKIIINGSYKRKILPKKDSDVTEVEREYELCTKKPV